LGKKKREKRIKSRPSRKERRDGNEDTRVGGV
jgi:hypothetical protein